MGLYEKKGNVPTILLFMVALGLMVMTLFAFAGYNDLRNNLSHAISNAVSEAEFNYKYIVKTAELAGKEAIVESKPEEVKENFIKITALKDMRMDNLGNLFGKIRNREFVFEKRRGLFVLEIDDLFVRAQSGKNKIKRNFDLVIEFRENGEVHKIYKELRNE